MMSTILRYRCLECSTGVMFDSERSLENHLHSYHLIPTLRLRVVLQSMLDFTYVREEKPPGQPRDEDNRHLRPLDGVSAKPSAWRNLERAKEITRITDPTLCSNCGLTERQPKSTWCRPCNVAAGTQGSRIATQMREQNIPRELVDEETSIVPAEEPKDMGAPSVEKVCKYQPKGCTYKSQWGPGRLNHEKGCAFGPTPGQRVSKVARKLAVDITKAKGQSVQRVKKTRKTRAAKRIDMTKPINGFNSPFLGRLVGELRDEIKTYDDQAKALKLRQPGIDKKRSVLKTLLSL